MVRHIGLLIAAVAATALSTVAFGADVDWRAVDEAMGRSGAMQPGDVHKYSIPRTDLKVTVDGVAVKPALALGSWVAFKDDRKEGSGHAMAMGDLVLTETEIAPVMKSLVESGLQVTAVHNHILRASPATLYMHIAGTGDPVKLAQAIRVALAKSAMLQETPSPAEQALGLDTAALEAALGQKGKAAGGTYQFSIPRAETVQDMGMEIPPAMGTAIAINVQSAGDGKAATTGDFVLTTEEVEPVVQALVANGIEVTALHTHMLGEEPRLIFMHFWGVDDPAKLGSGLRAALDKVNIARSQTSELPGAAKP
ncbi:DUF1259 domain-containing protein [Azospirillum canadense]|uniref:DUF1259 domain-containing protein n=1 Tax=Azospirillum canadense TaxID=403962 RepID=UPI002226751C|nr:DUF1259 domain-containing protein [Azospirillum canadense]MCW2244177.1 hypothetical protein [Azospirillum canadense]